VFEGFLQGWFSGYAVRLSVMKTITPLPAIDGGGTPVVGHP